MKTLSTTAIIFLFTALTLCAQHKMNRILTMQVQTTRVDTASFLDFSDSTTTFSARMKVFLMDTTGISKIVVTLKKSKNDSSSLLQHDFVFDSSPGSGYSYNRKKHAVELGLGTFTGIQHLYAEVKIQKTDGSYSDPITFTR